MSYFELYNNMRRAAQNFRPSTNYRKAWSRPRRDSNGGTSVCPSCTEPLEPGARCVICDVAGVDESAARVQSFARWSVLTRAAHRITFGARALRRADREIEREVRAAAKRAVRLRGRISVIAPVVEPGSGQSAGAYVSRWTDEERCECRDSCRATMRWVVTQSDAGLLTFECGDVRAFVGFAGEPLRIWTHDARPETAIASHGDEVEIVGTLIRRPEIAVELAQSDYRSPATTHMSLEGPGWLLIRGPGSSR